VMRAVGEGRSGAAEEALVQRAIALLRGQGADALILACTEFPLALSAPLDADIINPAELLAETAVCAALAE
jgi:aspartate/glutamate racemase